MFNEKNFRRAVGAFVLAVSISIGSFAANSHDPQSKASASTDRTDDSQWG